MKSETAKVFKPKDIKPENCTASNNEKSYASTIVQGKAQIHHNMVIPARGKEGEKQFHMELPPCISSSIIATLGDDGVTASYRLFLDIRGKYSEYVEKVDVDIKAMLSKTEESTKPEEYKTVLYQGLKDKNKSQSQIDKFYNEIVPRTQPLTPEIFRNVVYALLVPDYFHLDQKGNDIIEFCENLRKCYVDEVDSKIEIKEAIYSSVGIPQDKLDESCSPYVKDVFKYQRFDEKHLTMKKKIDYSKSPQIEVKLWESIPRGERKKDAIVVSQTGQVLWTKVFDWVNHPLRTTPITSADELDFAIYRKGDGANGIKSPFKLLVKAETLAPSIFWGEAQKEGAFQIKATKLIIMEYIQLGGGSRSMSNEEHQRILQEGRDAIAYYNLSEDNSQHQQAVENDLNGKRNFDNYQGDMNDNNNDGNDFSNKKQKFGQ